ncbi:hypothetical protein GCM10010278_86490 [Streptomyces melanogenes]|nr:hypothetical protein GCM10010278_86490 [Streptomyces melanogenes]
MTWQSPRSLAVLIPLDTADGPGALLVPYPSMLDVPHELVEHVSWLIYDRRREVKSRWRKLGCFKQALLALAHLLSAYLSECTTEYGDTCTTAQATSVSRSMAWRRFLSR